MTDLALVDMRWISEERVRWGRVDASVFAEMFEDEGSGGVLGDVVEMARRLVVVVLGW